MSEFVNGVEGEWVPDDGSDRNAGSWRFNGGSVIYVNGDYGYNEVTAQWEKFVPDEPKLNNLPYGSIVELPNSGGGVYIKTHKGWKYISVFGGEVTDVYGEIKGNVIRTGKGDDND